ncbi:alpha/beta fold hydrolase [Pleomorphovibrio marinus]|uniref:alpha/beta fold hydrolase n=1 Tax=Pleomorphovibrio marinus TaxID=2164132 RepID=UPI000E0AF094|nr:alpha/beta hydrolase [Pleomorphovibrio marinus]
MPIIQSNGINVFYEERGQGAPLLLIMGITAPSSVWEKHVEEWEKHFRCILIDNRGVGKSDKPAGSYTTAMMADDCAGVLNHLGLENTHVVGVSMGSTIAQQLALRHPSLVGKMVLMCPWARCDAKAKSIFLHMKDCKARLRPEEFATYVQLLIWSKNTWDDEEAYQQLMEDRKNAANDPSPQPLIGLEGQADACINHSVLEELSILDHQVLVVGGEVDEFTPIWMTKEVAAAIPKAQLHIYQGSGHAFHWENLENFNYLVKNWLLNV